MWIIFAIGSLLAESIETAADKIALVTDETVDVLAATTLRVFFYCLVVGVVGWSGILGKLHVFIPAPILILGLLCGLSSIFYTYLLKHIEATGYAALSYASPILYLLIDTFIVKAHLDFLQIIGIFLLTIGGILFVINPKRFRLKKEFTPAVLAIFAFSFAINAFEYYSFKFYYSAGRINEISFYFNVFTIALLALAVTLILKGKLPQLKDTVLHHTGFMKTIFVSKIFDAICSILWLYAIALATVSQVNAMNALYPLMLMVALYIAQKVFQLTAKEDFSQKKSVVKFGAVLLLCVGGILIR